MSCLCESELGMRDEEEEKEGGGGGGGPFDSRWWLLQELYEPHWEADDQEEEADYPPKPATSAGVEFRLGKPLRTHVVRQHKDIAP